MATVSLAITKQRLHDVPTKEDKMVGALPFSLWAHGSKVENANFFQPMHLVFGFNAKKRNIVQILKNVCVTYNILQNILSLRLNVGHIL